MKDVPTQMAQGIQQAAVLKRASWKDVFVPHPKLYDGNPEKNHEVEFVHSTRSGSVTKTCSLKLPLRPHPTDPRKSEEIVVATGSARRAAQWLKGFPDSRIENLRGNVNTRLHKLAESNWHGAIFAAAGLERIGLRSANAVDLDWMLPAPAQGAIVVVCREDDEKVFGRCQPLNHEATALCTQIEKDFLRMLQGGCSMPISALAQKGRKYIHFQGNVCSPDGKDLVSVSLQRAAKDAASLGEEAARLLLTDQRAQRIIQTVRHER